MNSVFGIADWKINSEEERNLAAEADICEEGKFKYVEYYRKADPAYFEKGLMMVNQVIDVHKPYIDKEQRNGYVIDMIYSLHRFGCMFNEYFMFDYENLNTNGRSQFITDKIRWYYYLKLNRFDKIKEYDDKERTYQKFSQSFGRELIIIRGMEDHARLIQFANKHKSFCIKPFFGGGGKGFEVIRDASPFAAEKIIKERDFPFVAEELIIQHPIMGAFHSKSVNTLRMPTIYDGTKVSLFHPILRTGTGGSPIDNTTRGGIFASVDPKTGIVDSVGLDRRGRRFVRHPETGIVFPGFQIPEWEKAVNLVSIVAQKDEGVHYVGWDIAFSKKGWVLVEGNANAEFVGWQSVSRRGVRQEIDAFVSYLCEENRVI